MGIRFPKPATLPPPSSSEEPIPIMEELKTSSAASCQLGFGAELDHAQLFGACAEELLHYPLCRIPTSAFAFHAPSAAASQQLRQTSGRHGSIPLRRRVRRISS